MNSRRNFLKLSATVSACAAAATQAYGALTVSAANVDGAGAGGVPALYKVLGDARHPASVAFVDAARAQGLAAQLLPRGDVSRFWYQELQLAWQRAPVAVAGLTEQGPLFCLEQLAMPYGLRVKQRESVVTTEGTALVAWLIAPRLG
jgi:hypothetical protein